ncbi:Short-chain dehydrogenase [Haloechinothrix alba]|uniref:Short-chain dehydrogenase n=1 Tax=Haloechinothrix alba TaxID=664784 RepID=A0A238VFR3_9PSEU|nr:SDR family oxidoreductase [Haloechinothrix alba]SNR33230.1 Short-chain dehydrogenase [Haloechinothrix alba]
MKLHGTTIVVTGAGRGIGAALARSFAGEYPRGIVVADVDAEGVSSVADEIRDRGVAALGVHVDVSDSGQVATLVRETEHAFGPPDVVCSNAGIAMGQGLHAAQQHWARSWAVNVMAHVHLAQAVLPRMSVRGQGYFLLTASAAGLLGLPGDAPYSVTKGAAVGLAEWLAMTYGDSGVGVGVLCPLGVRTDLLMPAVDAGHPAARAVAEHAPIITPEEVADAALRGIACGEFLILPHPEVRAMYATKATDPQAWLARHTAS